MASTSFCIIHNKEHEALGWRNRGKGWECFEEMGGLPEFVPQRIKNDRVEHFNSTLQPTRGGEVSREYIETYGSKGMSLTEKEVKSAKYVYKDLPGWHTRHKSK